MHRLLAATAMVTLGWAGAASATNSTTYSDGTFSLSNYATQFTVLSDPSDTIAVSQCSACGNPGNGLSIILSFPDGGGTFNAPNDIGITNTTFVYNPATTGAITSISASVDKNIGVNVVQGFGNFFHPLIEQDGLFYEGGIGGPVLNGPGSTGYNTLSASGLTAASFTQIDPTTGLLGTAHPNFAGDPIVFGLVQSTGADTIPGTIETVAYDNLSFTVTSVPEPATWAMMMLGFGGLGAAMRSRRRLVRATA